MYKEKGAIWAHCLGGFSSWLVASVVRQCFKASAEHTQIIAKERWGGSAGEERREGLGPITD